MDKHEIRELLERYQQGKATLRETAMVEAFMVISESEETIFTEMENSQTQQRIWAKLEPRKTSRIVKMPARFIRVAAIALLVLGASILGYLFRNQLEDHIAPIAMRTIETGPYEIKQLTMPDSSVVTLAQNSRLSFPERYRSGERYAALSGKAFFDIKQNAAMSFQVKSRDLDIKVLGTAFEVADAQSGYEASVMVSSGKVAVSHGKTQLAVLSGNQQVKYDKFSGQSEISKEVNVAAATGWTRKQLVFDEVPLSVVMKTLQVYYGMRIIVQGNAIRENDTFSGVFSRNETKKEVLDVICFSAGLRYSFTRDSSIIIRQ